MLVALPSEAPSSVDDDDAAVEGPIYQTAPAPVPALEPLAAEPKLDSAPPALPPTGNLGGVLGATAGCAAGAGLPAIVIGAGSGILYGLFSGAAAGTVVGWTPACAALGTSCGIASSAFALPLLGSGAATAGAMIGAQGDGRDPMPALYGGLPGLGLAGISTALSCSAVLVGCGGLAAVQPVAFLLLGAVLTGAVAPPCSALGAGVADVIWGAVPIVVVEEKVAIAAERPLRTAMRF